MALTLVQTVPVVQFHEEAADRAYAEYKALARVETYHPALRHDPDFQFARRAAFRRFEAAFQRA